MKIVLLNTSDSSGGAAIACRRLQKALSGLEGVEARIVVQEKTTADPAVIPVGDSWWGRKKAWLRFVLERLVFLPFERSKAIRFLFNPGVAGTDISNHPLVREADVIHLHWITFGFLSVESVRRLLQLGKPVVWTFHDMWPFTGGCHHSGECENYTRACGNCPFLSAPSNGDLSNRRWIAKNQAYLPPFTAVACSRWLKGRADESSLLKGFRTEAIPNPLDTGLFSPGPKQEARKALGLDAEKEYLLFAAMRVTAAGKGFGYFKEAVRLLFERKPEYLEGVELLVFGQADPEALEELPVKTNFLGYLKNSGQMVTAYRAASMFITPSLEENLPNTIMEAMACGTPSVGFRVGGIPEMIDHLENGYVAAYKSASSLADGIAWVLAHNAGGALSEAARQKVVREYEEKIVAEKYFELYASLLA